MIVNLFRYDANQFILGFVFIEVTVHLVKFFVNSYNMIIQVKSSRSSYIYKYFRPFNSIAASDSVTAHHFLFLHKLLDGWQIRQQKTFNQTSSFIFFSSRVILRRICGPQLQINNNHVVLCRTIVRGYREEKIKEMGCAFWEMLRGSCSVTIEWKPFTSFLIARIN